MKYYKVKSKEECEKYQEMFEIMKKYCNYIITGIQHPRSEYIYGPLNDEWTWNRNCLEEIEYNGCV